MLEIAILNISVISKDQRSYPNKVKGAGYRSINPGPCIKGVNVRGMRYERQIRQNRRLSRVLCILKENSVAAI